MAVPGNITSPLSVGTNRLIRDGAAPLLHPIDLLQHFPEFPPPALEKGGPVPTAGPLPDTLSPKQRELAAFLDSEPVHPDELACRSHLPINEVLSILGGLEIAGVVEQGPGRVFRRV